MVIVAHRFETSPTRSETNLKLATEPRPNTNNVQAKDQSQSLEDYLNPAATRQFLAFTHEQYKKHLGEEFGKTILGFRGDEPDYSVSGLPWTQAFFDRFQQVKGYDIRPYLATFLLPRGVAMTQEQARARADYWDVFSILFAESFFKVQGDWCAANHLEYQVHLNHEEAELELTHSEGEFFRDMRSGAGSGDRYDAASDLDGHDLRLSAAGVVCVACLWQAEGVYRELCLVQTAGGCGHGAICAE